MDSLNPEVLIEPPICNAVLGKYGTQAALHWSVLRHDLIQWLSVDVKREHQTAMPMLAAVCSQGHNVDAARRSKDRA